MPTSTAADAKRVLSEYLLEGRSYGDVARRQGITLEDAKQRLRLAESWLPGDLLRQFRRDRLITIAERAHRNLPGRAKRYIACRDAGLNDEEAAYEVGVSIATLPKFMPGLPFRAARRPRAIYAWYRWCRQQKARPRARTTSGGRGRPGVRRSTRTSARAGPSDSDDPGGAGDPEHELAPQLAGERA